MLLVHFINVVNYNNILFRRPFLNSHTYIYQCFFSRGFHFSRSRS